MKISPAACKRVHGRRAQLYDKVMEEWLSGTKTEKTETECFTD